MTYQALARKYRPQTFADVLGQDSIVRTLENSIEQNRIHQAYLFSGVRGVGKTTTARIFAKALNCAEGPTRTPCNQCSICREITEGIDLDVREIDAATYTQVDNIRELREVTQFQPARDRNRIFIIDEAHMLSAGAWNALLKLIEEPPPHVVFMLATTEMHKVPQTILSRVQQFIFRRVTREELIDRLAAICTSEGIDASRDALAMIARRGDGSVRDSLSLLDQAVAFRGRTITAADVATILGLSDNSFFADLVRRIREGDQATILETLEEAAESGRDFKLLYRDLLAYLRNLMLLAAGAPDRILQLDSSELESLRQVVKGFDSSELVRLINLLLRDEELIQRSEQQRLAVEIAILKAATLPRLRAIEELIGGAPGGAVTKPPAKRSGASSRSAAPTPDASGGGSRAGSPDPTDADAVARRIAEQVSAESRIVGSYLGLAKSCRVREDEVLFEYDESQRFVAEHLNEKEAVALVERVASSVRGKRTAIRFVIQEPVSAVEPPSGAAAQADPVVEAFARHLGGEIIRGGSRGE